MVLETKHFGKLEIQEDSILQFKEGIPGFEEVHRFVLLDSPDEESPFKWLQCIDQPALAFVVINPFIIKKDYDFELKEDVVKILDLQNQIEAAVYSIVVVPDDTAKISMNLKAPVVINARTRAGMQVVLENDKYSVRHYILEELRRQEVEENAGSNKKKRSNHRNR